MSAREACPQPALDLPGWRQIRPLPIVFERGPRHITVSDGVSLDYGVGDTLEEAVADYRLSLLSTLEWYEQHAATLAQGLAADRLRLLEYVSRCD